MRRSIIAANWKMHKSIDQGLAFIKALKEKYPKTHPVEVVVCAPFTMLFSLAEKAIGSSIAIGGQNLFWEPKGAYTGEISGEMLIDAGCEYVVIGHSERRQYFHETDDDINKKIHAALRDRLKVIFCIGETLEQRKSEETLQVIEKQVQKGLRDISEAQLQHINIAYEPIWAIGTGVTASPGQAAEVHASIRKLIAQNYSESAAEKMRILYGGSVKPSNVNELMALDDIDGALVGGASLELDSFIQLVNFS